MDKVINCLFAAITLLLSVRGEVFKGKEDYLEMLARTERCAAVVRSLYEDDFHLIVSVGMCERLEVEFRVQT